MAKIPMEQRPPTPGRLWYLHRQKGIPLNTLTRVYHLNRTRIYRLICEGRERHGEVVIGEAFMSRAWILARVRAGMSPQQIADEAFCSRSTVVRRMQQYDIPAGPRGNPQFRSLHNRHGMRVSEKTEGENAQDKRTNGPDATPFHRDLL